MKYCAVSLFFLTIVGFSVNTNAANDAVKQRSDWYLGFAVGHGTVFDANYEQDGQKTKFEDWADSHDYNQAIYNVKGGVTLSKNWLVGLDFSIVNYANGGFVADDINLKDINIKNYYVIATYFPKGSGWLLRTGGGMSRLVKIEEFKNDHDKDTERHTRGFGYTLGGGYSFWIGEQFNLSVYLDYSKQIYKDSSNEPDYSQFTALYLGFDWY